MSYLGDTLTIGLILILLFGSIALYLYTRVQQTEQKVGLLESIVLDLKLTGEIQSFAEPSVSQTSSLPLAPVSAPVTPSASSSPASQTSSLPLAPVIADTPVYTPFKDEEDQDLIKEDGQEQEVNGVLASEEVVNDIEFLPLDTTSQESIVAHSASSYDGLSLKELQAQVRARGLSVERGAKKHALIELLKQHDASEANEAKPDQMTSFTPLESTSLDNE
jgi:hypothetical protein